MKKIKLDIALFLGDSPMWYTVDAWLIEDTGAYQFAAHHQVRKDCSGSPRVMSQKWVVSNVETGAWIVDNCYTRKEAIERARAAINYVPPAVIQSDITLFSAHFPKPAKQTA